MKLLKLALCFCLLAPAALAASGPEPNAAPAAVGNTPAALALDFAAALRFARQSNKPFLIAEKQEEAAHAHWWQALLALGPTASLQAGYILADKPMVSVMDFNSGFSMPGLPSAGSMEIEIVPTYYSGQLQVTQPLFYGFKLADNLNLAGLQYQNAQASRQLAESQLYVDVTEAYYGYAVALELLKVTEDLVRQTQDHLAVVQARFKEGEASNYDLLRSEVQLANLKPQLLQARNSAALAKKSLLLTIGLDPERAISMTDGVCVVNEPLPAMEDMESTALAERLEIRNLERNRSMAEINHFLAATSNLPNVALSACWTYYDNWDSGYPPVSANLLHSWTVTLGLNWPFWDNLSAIPKATEAAAQASQAELSRESLADNIRLEVERYYLDLTTAREMLSAQQKTIEQAQAGYRLASEQYANGMMTNIDVMDAQLALNQAKTNFLQTQYNYILSQVKLRKAVGEVLMK